ncbi:protein dj-1beta [Hetaerina americana]|uniref:protein dj-1beta n=1 Tax=Hetaerina americana TaxID=62018 RepID=UPI003A7F22AC
MNIFRLSIGYFKRFSTCNMSGKSALVILAEGAEEMEFVISVDVLRRAEIKVDVAGLDGIAPVKCSRDVVITPDISLDDASSQSYDVVVLPGGKASQTLADSEKVGNIIREQEKSGRLVAAICAAPIALKSHGVGTGKNLTSYPSVKEQMVSGDKYKYSEERVVVDGNLLTSRGPGTAFEFALAIVDKLVGKDAVDNLKKAMLVNC